MNWYGRILAGVAPEYQLRRLKAMAITRMAYEAAKPTRNNRAKREARGPNAAMQSDAKAMRYQVRHFEQNSDVISAALDILVANTIGSGIRPEPMVKDLSGNLLEDVNNQLMALWADWARCPEVTWTLDEFSAQRLSARSFFRDGEVLRQDIVGRSALLNHGTKVPYSYEMIEADLLNDMKTDATQNIVQGVEMNAWGRPIAYHVLKSLQNDIAPSTPDSKRVSAENIVHLKLVRRIRQARGVTAFAPVLKRLGDIDDIDESERIAARVAAAMAWYIKKGDPALYTPPDADSDEGERELDLYPGMGFDDLRPGEDIGTIASNRPNNALIPYLQYQLKRFSGGIGVSYSSQAKDYSGTYSSQRQEMVEQRVIYGMMWNYFVERSERPKWQRFVDAATLAGLVDMPSDVDADSIADCDFATVAMPWIDPAKEAEAFVTLIDNELESRSHIIRLRGRDPREVRRQIDQEGGPIKKEAPVAPTAPPANPEEQQMKVTLNIEEGAILNESHVHMPDVKIPDIVIPQPHIENTFNVPEVKAGDVIVNVPRQATPAPVIQVTAPEYEVTEQIALRDSSGRLDKMVTTRKRRK